MASNKSIFGGIVAPPDREDIIRMRRTEQLANNMKLYGQGSNLATQQAAQAGAMFGTIFGSMASPQKLTAAEERQQKIFSGATELQKARKSDPAFAEMDAEDQQLAYAEDLAQSMADAGETAQAAEIAINVAQRRETKKKAALEYTKLENDIDAQDLDYTVKLADNRRKNAGEYGAFVPRGEGGYDFTSENPELVSGKVDEDGQLIKDDGTKVRSYLSLDDYTKLKKEVAAMRKAGGAGDTTAATKLFLKLIGESERKERRVAQQATFQQVQIMNGVADAMERQMAKGLDPAAMLDGTGKVIDFATNLQSTIKAIGGAIFNVPIMNGDQVVAADSQGWISKNSDFLKEAIRLPPGMEEAGSEAANYRAAVAELAFATGRANEPSAKQLSDHDYKVSLTQIGANAADPEKLRQVIMYNLTRKMATHALDVEQAGDIAEEAGLAREKGIAMIYGGETHQRFIDEVGKVQKRYEGLAGTLAQDKAKRNAVTTGGMPGAPNAQGQGPTNTAMPVDDFSYMDNWTDAQMDAFIESGGTKLP